MTNAFSPILFVVIVAVLFSAFTAAAAPNGTSTLSAGQTLTINASGCALKVKTETAALVVVKCKASANAPQGTDLLAPSAKVTLTAGQKQKVLPNQCNLSVTKKTASVVKVKCIGAATATPTSTNAAGQTATATATRTLTTTPTPTPTQPAGSTIRVSVATNGTQANNPPGAADISDDGRYVVFDSYANTLVSGDSNWNCSGANCSDIFVHDMQTGETTLVSRASDGTQGLTSSQHPSISADGRYVAFDSDASNLVPANMQYCVGCTNVFVHDRQTGQTIPASVTSGGQFVGFSSDYPSISADGRYVAFHSWSGALGGPTNNDTAGWIYVHDMQTGQTTQVSVASDGSATTGSPSSIFNINPAISPNGRYVGFYSNADNLASGDTSFPCDISYSQPIEHCFDVYVHDMQTGETTRVSVATDGKNGTNAMMYGSKISFSSDGRYVMFDSSASNLVGGDTNNACSLYPYLYNCADVFVYDRQTGRMTRASLDTNGSQFGWDSYAGAISANGRYVTFSGAIVIPLLEAQRLDFSAYVRDLQTGQTTEYSRANNGGLANPDSYAGTISADGRFALFSSGDGNLVPGDTNYCYNPPWGNCFDLFVRQRW